MRKRQGEKKTGLILTSLSGGDQGEKIKLNKSRESIIVTMAEAEDFKSRKGRSEGFGGSIEGSTWGYVRDLTGEYRQSGSGR